MDEFELPESLTDLSDDDIGALEGQALEAFDAVAADLGQPDALTNMGLLADAIDALRAEAGRRYEQAAEAMDAAIALAARVHGEPEDSTTEPDTENTEPDADGGSDAGEPGQAAPDAPTAPDVEVTVNNDAPEPVLASAPRRGRISVPLGSIRRHAPDPQVEADAGMVTITAASDLPGFTSGSRLSGLTEVAQAMHSRARSLTEGGSGIVASIELPRNPATHIRSQATQEEMTAALDAAVNPASLTAAGGWCAPSQQVFDFFNIASTDGLIDLPTVTIDRGGIEFPTSPSIADVFSVPWEWTEADDIAALGNPHVVPADDRTKPCFRIPCPGWTEVRLGAHGICLTHGNLSDRAFPENTRNYVDLVLAAHAHVMSQRRIIRMLALQTAVTIAASTASGATASLLAAVELQVLDYRSKFRMSDNSTLEAVFPSWITGVIRADLSRRSGIAEMNVTDAQIGAWFSARGIRPQYVADWQVLSNTGVGAAGDGFVEVWPATAIFMLYAAGTYVGGTGGMIDLGVTRDAQLNATNDHTVAFTEEFDLVAKRGHEGRKVTVTICPNGSTGTGGAITCPVA